MAVSDYAGDLDCRDAYALLEREPQAQLIDVRTSAEWNFVGLPDLSALDRRPLLIAWQSFPDGARNPNFTAEVDAALARSGAKPGAPLLLLCRSGGRSAAAAAELTAAGYGPAYNVAGGFEGDLDEFRHRGRKGGWKAAGLPWVQS